MCLTSMVILGATVGGFGEVSAPERVAEKLRTRLRTRGKRRAVHLAQR